MEGIIVGVDESPYAEAALRWAVEHAAHSHQPVTAVMVWGYVNQRHVDPNAPLDPHYDAEVAAKVLEELVQRAVGLDRGVTPQAVCDLPADGLLRASEDAALLVIGARTMGAARAMSLNSTSRQVLRRATCPVAVIRDDADRVGRPIVIGIDGSAPSQRALQWALDLARIRGFPVVALHAWHLPYTSGSLVAPYPSEDKLAAEADEFLRHQIEREDTSGLAAPVECRSLPARPADALLEAATLASMVVVGSRGRSGLTAAVLGSVSDRVSHYAACPVIVVP